ncbi:MAG: hypothetical protein NZU63_03835 [Gemmataceae bacterium]|nr:hypothetical protein [Gemmataceae bacterium]MDW8243431.1 hypothetical protein [Thermogemmata sp.]
MRGVLRVGLIALAAAGGAGIANWFVSSGQPTEAASNDRYGDYIMATGAVAINPRIPTDGVWLLDYKAGKLLGTVIDRNSGKIIGWAEVDLTAEFGLARQADVHFMMTTGYITQGQSALYLAETTTGQFGVYTMGSGPNGTGIVIRRHDLTRFREAPPGGALPGVGPAGGMPAPAAAGTVGGVPAGFPAPSAVPGVGLPPSSPPTSGVPSGAGTIPAYVPAVSGGSPAGTLPVSPPIGSPPTPPWPNGPGGPNSHPPALPSGSSGRTLPQLPLPNAAGSDPASAPLQPSLPSGGPSGANMPRISPAKSAPTGSNPPAVNSSWPLGPTSSGNTSNSSTWPTLDDRTTTATTGNTPPPVTSVPAATVSPTASMPARLPPLAPLPPVGATSNAGPTHPSGPATNGTVPPPTPVGPPNSYTAYHLPMPYATPPYPYGYAPPPLDPTYLLMHFLRPLPTP